MTLAVLREGAWPARPSAALRAQRQATEEYFGNNLHRMEYPEYQAEGWQIGSGVVESACKHVVASRCKRAGMRWDENGAENILALRCLALNERWDSAWEKVAA